LDCTLKINRNIENVRLPEKGVRIKLVKFEENSATKPRIESIEYVCVAQTNIGLINCLIPLNEIEKGQYFVDLFFGSEVVLNVVQGLVQVI